MLESRLLSPFVFFPVSSQPLENLSMTYARLFVDSCARESGSSGLPGDAFARGCLCRSLLQTLVCPGVSNVAAKGAEHPICIICPITLARARVCDGGRLPTPGGESLRAPSIRPVVLPAHEPPPHWQPFPPFLCPVAFSPLLCVIPYQP
jgi:hypothetical protein